MIRVLLLVIRDMTGAGGDERMVYADEAEADKLGILTEETRADRITIRLMNGRPVSMLKSGKPPAHHIPLLAIFLSHWTHTGNAYETLQVNCVNRLKGSNGWSLHYCIYMVNETSLRQKV